MKIGLKSTSNVELKNGSWAHMTCANDFAKKLPFYLIEMKTCPLA